MFDFNLWNFEYFYQQSPNSFIFLQLNSLQSEIEGLYGKAKVCVGHGKCLPLEPGEKIHM